MPSVQYTKNLLISFSGGETSAYMTKWILDNWSDKYEDIFIVFANTGEEHEETLKFVKRCDDEFGFGTVWVEAIQSHNARHSGYFRTVSYETASRNGEPFEDAIRKYGIPNQKFKDCTRNLKRIPIEKAAKELKGWNQRDYDLAIGIRADEQKRVSPIAYKRQIVYPMVHDSPTTKPQINYWWSQQSFRLNLKSWQGNCKWCWKKSKRKHFTLINHDPSVFDFPHRMEQQYGKVGPEFKKDPATRERPITEDYRRTFFRGNQSVGDLFAEYRQKVAEGKFNPAEDEADVYDSSKFDPELDQAGACDEHCEVYDINDEADGES